MVMLAFAMMAVIRHHATAAAKKKATPNHGKNKTIGASSLIRWSIQEVRPASPLGSLRKRIQPAHINRMVTLAQSSPGDRSARAPQSKRQL